MSSLPISPKRREQIISQYVDNTRVLLNLATGDYFTLDDEVGFRVWELCDGSHTVAQMVKSIAEEFDAPSDTIQTDLVELLDAFLSEKLLLPDN